MADVMYYLKALRRNGLLYSCVRLAEKAKEKYLKEYDKLWQKLKPTEQELERQRQEPIEGVGRISILIPVYNTRPEFLRELADSLVSQTYPDWEACLYDGLSTNPLTLAALDEMAARDSRLHILHGKTNEGISGNTNRALEMATGEWVALCDHDDLLTPDALYRMAEAARDTGADMLYSDEDKISEDGSYHHSPHFKPDYSPDSLNSGNYICHLMMLRRNLVESVGGLRSEFDGSQDHDLAIRCAEQANKIVHVPRILYHWRTVGTSMSHQHLDQCVEASARTAKEHMARIGYPCTYEIVNGQPHFRYEVSREKTFSLIIIDSGDPVTWPGFLRRLVSIDTDLKRTIVVSPTEESANDVEGCRWICWDPHETVYAALNRAMELCESDFVCIIHSGVLMEGRAWLNELAGYAQRDDVGAVAPQIVGEWGGVVHGGFAVGLDKVLSCRGRGLPRRVGGYHLLMTTSHNVGAVSLACMMFRRDHFVPFDERYQSGIGAADWCIRMAEKYGSHHVFTPMVYGKTRDSVTKEWLLALGNENENDAAMFRQAHPDYRDPCYPQMFSRKKADYTLRKEP